jgi:hypothetical protein
VGTTFTAYLFFTSGDFNHLEGHTCCLVCFIHQKKGKEKKINSIFILICPTGRLSSSQLVNDLGFSSWSGNAPRAISLWSINEYIHQTMKPGGRFHQSELDLYSKLSVRHPAVLTMSGQALPLPGGDRQTVFKGCGAFPVRHTHLRVAADAHGFTGDVVDLGSSTRLFKLVVALPSTQEPRFVKPSVGFIR